MATLSLIAYDPNRQFRDRQLEGIINGPFPMPSAAPEPITEQPPQTGSTVPTPSAPVDRTYYTAAQSQQIVSVENVAVVKQMSDNGAGSFANSVGSSIDYTSGTLRFLPVDTYEFVQWINAEGVWERKTAQDNWTDGSLIRVWYRPDSLAPQTETENLPALRIGINLTPFTGDNVVPGSVQFAFAGSTYIDRDGRILRNVQPGGAGTLSGTIDYSTGYVVLTDWDAGPGTFALQSLLTWRGQFSEVEMFFYTDQAPIKSGSLQLRTTAVDGEELTAASDADGNIVGDEIAGTVDYLTGLCHVRFGRLVAADTLTNEERQEDWFDPANIDGNGMIWRPRRVIPPTARYNCVVLSFLPVDADILGLDPVRLPTDGRVPFVRAGDVVMLMHHDTISATPELVNGAYQIDLGRTRIAFVRIHDANGDLVPNGYDLDRAAGILRFPNIVGLQTPLTVRHTVGDLRRVNEVQITGRIGFIQPLTHDYPAGSILSSCLLHGDRRARVSLIFDQRTWNRVTWSDQLEGDAATATLDTITHPVQVTNKGAITERWAIYWTNATEVEIYGEHRGLVYKGPFNADLAPVNPATRNADGTGGVPYFVIPVAANGGGWIQGNLVRFNTVGALTEMWIARAIQPSDIPSGDGEDGCELACLGNIDRP